MTSGPSEVATPRFAPASPGASGLGAAAAELRKAGRILITTHINPDGDAIGSALGLMHILRAAG